MNGSAGRGIKRSSLPSVTLLSAGLPSHGLVRLNVILAPNGPIPVSRSTWWAGVKSGRFPKPIKLGPRITAWRAEDIHRLIDGGVET